jgi:hypothetical protein
VHTNITSGTQGLTGRASVHTVIQYEEGAHMPCLTRSRQIGSLDSMPTLHISSSQRETFNHLDLSRSSRKMPRLSSNVVLAALLCGLILPVSQSK